MDRAVTICAVVVVHNMAEFLPEALGSVLAQTRPADQIVVCDDASEDDIEAAVAPFRDKITWVRLDRQSGEAAARNAAVAQTSCTWAATLDADDVWHPDRLRAFFSIAAGRPDVDLVTSDLQEFGPYAQETPPATSWFPVEDQRALILRRNYLPAPAIRLSALRACGGFNESLDYGPDWECYARMIVGGSRALLVPERMYFYRRWSGQQSAARLRVMTGDIAVLTALLHSTELSSVERADLSDRVSRLRTEVWLHALTRGRAPRGAAFRILVKSRTPLKTRVFAVMAMVSPGLAVAFYQHRHGG